MPLTFGNLDPYHRHRQLERLGEGLSLFMQVRQQKQAERDRERQQALSRFFELAEKMPEVAAQAGPDIVRRYGKDVPELQGMVDWLQNQGKVRQRLQSAGERYLQTADQLAQRNEARATTPGQGPLAGISPFANAPQLANVPSAATAPGQPGSDLAFVEAARTLSPSDRQAAELWAKQEGVPFPERFQPSPFDPYEDLTQKGRGLLAAQRGEVTGEVAEGQRIQAGLPGFETAGQKLQREMEAKRDARARELADLRDRRTAAGQEIQRRKVSVQERREERLRAGGSAAVKPRELAGEVKSSLLDSQKLMTPSKDEKGEAVALGPKAQGATGKAAVRRPTFRPMNDAQAARLASTITRDAVQRAKKSGADPYDLAFTATESAFNVYTDLVLRGIAPRDAVLILLGEKEAPKDFNI